jgi:hypothetical protein
MLALMSTGGMLLVAVGFVGYEPAIGERVGGGGRVTERVTESE